MNEEDTDDQDMINAFMAAAMSGDEAILAFLRNVSFTGMSLGLALAILQLEASKVGSMEGVLSLLREHRDQWRHAADANQIGGL